jgi:serine protease Do
LSAPLLIENLPPAKLFRRGECIHCHQVNEIRRADLKARDAWGPESRWVWPLPENVGLVLEVDRGNHVRAVAPDSPAARAGLRAGDVLREVNGIAVASQADARHGLHRAPAAGRVAVTWEREGKVQRGDLELQSGWRKTNLTWRPSLLNVLPSLTVYGEDLTAAQKKALGLREKQLAFRQQGPVHKEARLAGVQVGDVIVGLNDLRLEMTMEEFLGYVRQNYLVGDRVMLNVLRNGKRLALPMTLR